MANVLGRDWIVIEGASNGTSVNGARMGKYSSPRARRAIWLIFPVAVAIACSSRAPKYPACERDEQCAVSGRHDYCVEGKCAYCRTSVDCGDRERCRGGACEPDPNAPMLPEAGADAGSDAEDEDETGDRGEESVREPPTRRYDVRVRELERRVRQLRRRRP